MAAITTSSHLFSASSTFVLCLLVLSILLNPVESVKRENFKTCSDSGFCSRNRAYADDAASIGSSWTSPYEVDPSSLAFQNGVLSGNVLKTVDAATKETVRLPLTVTFLESGAARVTIDEERRQKGDIALRHDSRIRKERYNEAQQWALVGGLKPSSDAKTSQDADAGTTRVLFGPQGEHEAIIKHSPFGIDFRRGGETQIRLNDRGLLNVEHWRPRVEVPQEDGTTKIPEGQETWWDETFGGNTDSKPKGPESIALDVTFPGYEHVYGVPEHTGPMSLHETRGGSSDKFTDPYRLYNSDVFEYEMDSPMTLYGAIPFMQAHRKGSTVGVFWLNAAETWIDIIKQKVSTNPLSLGLAGKIDTKTHWISESGLLDVFVLLGPSPKDISKTYGELTGYTQLPQLFAIAYHQCRWNYVTDQDVKDVDRKFDRHNIPYDVIWLDIEYTDGKKYFTWDPLTFSDPIGMQTQLEAHDRKLVAIIDPHIKKESYWVIDEMRSKELTVKNKDGNEYEGWCWPGASFWPDLFSPAASKWWQSLFTYTRFAGSTTNTFIWNDMNEPSVFNGPETTMPKDNIHFGGWEHRDVHNINGLTVVNSTFEAMLARDGSSIKTQKRPFILTRSFYAGSQRLGAMWTGDNLADWSHLAAAFPMILNNGISGFPFAGADVGGFFGNPEKELLTRWYQAGAFYPFFRAHAHIDSRRREPYLTGEPYESIITQALRLRYALLPAWYTAFHAASTVGAPIVRPNWYVHPDDERGFAIDDQLYLGETGLLFKPVTAKGVESVDIYISDAAPYYDYFTFAKYQGAGKKHHVPAPLDTIPLLMRGGHIIPRRDRPRRSSGLMRWDPFTLVVALNDDGTAEGELYLDDGESYAYTEGAYIHRKFVFRDGVLTSEDLDSSPNSKQKTAYLKSINSIVVEKIIIVGAPSAWSSKSSATVTEDGAKAGADGKRTAELVFESNSGGRAAWAVVKKPGLKISASWTVAFGA